MRKREVDGAAETLVLDRLFDIDLGRTQFRGIQNQQGALREGGGAQGLLDGTRGS